MNFVRPILLGLFGWCSLTLRAAPADTLTLFGRVMSDASPAEALPDGLLRNPAAEWYRQEFSLSELAIGYDRDRRGAASLAQEGDGYDGFGFAARSFVRTSDRGRAFGSAGYTNGTRRNVQWSETADFALLYPYVTADSVGGSLTSETYRFSGGYAYRTGAWTLAASLAYRALLEYREVDPRPRNVVSDLQASLAAARSVGARYELALALHGRKYGQRGDIAFYNDMYQATVYHMTGLGLDYVRFAGIQTSTNYSGWGAGGSVDLFPASRSGFSASVGYDYFTFSKQMSGLNNLPLVTVVDHTLRFVAAYGRSDAARAWGVTLEGDWRQRHGTEHIFGDATGNIYTEIATSSGYADRTVHATLSGFVGTRPDAERVVWWVKPSVSYLDFRSDYRSAARYLNFSRWQAGVDAGVMRAWGQWMLQAGAGVALSGRVAGEMALPGADFSSSRIVALQSNYRYLTDDFTRLKVNLRLNRQIGQGRMLFLRGEWTNDWFSACGTASGWSVAIGFGF